MRLFVLAFLFLGLEASATEVKQGQWELQVEINGQVESRETYVLQCSEHKAYEAVLIGKDSGASTQLSASREPDGSYRWGASFFNYQAQGIRYILEMKQISEDFFLGSARGPWSFEKLGSGQARFVSSEIPEDLKFLCD